MGIVGAALRGFGRALSKKSGTIKSVKPAKNLTARRKTHDEMVAAVDKQYKTKGVRPGQSGSKIKREATSKASAIHDRYEKASSDVKKYNKKLKRKVIGAGAASITGIVGAHGVAKHKFPKYKKFMERDITIKDGKVKLVPKKKK
jgi:hypothetical protein